ncbi:DUF378 domain-containing protein [Candidatus Pacearchaeota archaeon CG10_big_fil_rev_8_21_14_0_10_32_14]|nr:MAG: DUF378 domain-containing protein [Candidatus Pacearchaeota archaeon CG10_big_fil_rev_8_21_14_0_10_32_14]
MTWYEKIALVVVAIGAINWGLTALDWNVVEKLLGSWPMVVKIVYYIIALCGLYAIYLAFAKQ